MSEKRKPSDKDESARIPKLRAIVSFLYVAILEGTIAYDQSIQSERCYPRV
jgi:hypothetical protein